MFRQKTASIIFVLSLAVATCAEDKAVVPPREKKTDDVRPYRKLHALCIGINDYAEPSITDLHFAEADAMAMAKILKELYGFESVQTLLGPQATKQGMESAFAELQDPGLISKDDAVVLFFSGHGQTVKAGSKDIGYLIPQDASVKFDNTSNPRPYRSSCIPMDTIRSDASYIPARHVLFLVDACYSGFIAERSLDAPADVVNALRYPARQVITAGTSGEQAVEDGAWGHGAFTFKLLEILSTETEPLQASKLGVWLKERVPREVKARRPDKTLTPQAKYLSGEGDFIFIRPGSKLTGQSGQDGTRTPAQFDSKAYFRNLDQSRIIELVRASQFQEAFDRLADYEKAYGSDEFSKPLKDQLASRLIPAKPEREKMPDVTPPNPSNDKTLTLDLGGGVKMELVLIPAGSFLMGSPEGEEGRFSVEGPQHRVEITKPYYMGKYEVTQRQWQAVMGSNPSRFSDCPDCPVEQVSWDDIQRFLSKVSQRSGKSVRLPTEAEWEYGCRAGTTTPFHTGSTLSTSQANYDGNYTYGNGSKGKYRKETTEVGSFSPNGFGLYDMHGNVWEWCSDWFGADYYASSASRDPKGPSSGESRVLRGGTWCYYPKACRAALRYCDPPGNRNNENGFRVVASATP